MNWSPKPIPDEDKVKQLQKQIGVPFEIACIMIQRGIEDYDAAKSFFRPELSDLHDPFLMLGMKKAVDRIFQAIDTGEKIMVYGDSRIKAGQTIEILVPKTGVDFEVNNTNDAFASGKYLVVGVKHQIDDKEYHTLMTIVKDSNIVQPDDEGEDWR